MKVAVSYISSKYNLKNTILKINETTSDYIHMDIMDGLYVENKNFSKKDLKVIFKYTKKYLDVHFMVCNPEKYLKYFKNNNSVTNIYFHPSSSYDPFDFINKVKEMNITVGIVINPDENITSFKQYYKHIDKVLIMSVVPGAGGQKFIDASVTKIKELTTFREENNEIFEIAVDGGINDQTIKKLSNLDITSVISGSYICQSDNYEENINKLKHV